MKFTAGRNAYASALHCLLETVETYASQMSSKALAIRFVEDCAEVLVKYKADVGKVGGSLDPRDLRFLHPLVGGWGGGGGSELSVSVLS